MEKRPPYWRKLLAPRRADKTSKNQYMAATDVAHGQGRQAPLAIDIPPAVLTLMFPMVLIHLVGVVLPVFTDIPHFAARISHALALTPRFLFEGAGYRDGILAQFLPLITHSLVHANFMHLALNTVWLIIFGTAVARRLGADGRFWQLDSWLRINAFFLFFFSSVIFSGFLFALVQPNSLTQLVGASGGISALLGASMRFILRPHQPYGPYYGGLSSLREKPVVIFSLVYVFINLMSAFGGGFFLQTGNSIAWDVHLTGYFFGLLAFPYFDRYAIEAPSDRPTLYSVN
ncbi:MAG: rhomboid family intramembrane serine protease [Parvularculaceae bacterium]